MGSRGQAKVGVHEQFLAVDPVAPGGDSVEEVETEPRAGAAAALTRPLRTLLSSMADPLSSARR